MAFATKYLFKFQSVHGAEVEVRILKDGYSGSPIQRALGRPPVLKRQKSGPVCGTSLELYAECQINGEFAELYTSNPKEYQVQLLRGGVMFWTGFVSTELYSEPGIAPPYDVQIVATDGLGELKLVDFDAAGEMSLSEVFVSLLAATGSDRDIYFAWKFKKHNGTINGLLDNGLLDLDYMAGKTSYDVLVYLLNSFHATITARGNSWLVIRETDLNSSDSRLAAYRVPAGGQAAVLSYIDNINFSLGQMGVADLWPIGNYSSKIEPARKSVSVFSPWHLSNIIQDADFSTTPGPWSVSDADYVQWRHYDYGDFCVLGYIPELYHASDYQWIRQSFQMQALNEEIKLSALVGSMYLSNDDLSTPFVAFYVMYQTANVTYYGDSEGWGTTAPSLPRVQQEVQRAPMMPFGPRGEFNSIIPSPDIDEPGTLYVYFAGLAVALESVELLRNPATKGYKDTIHIDNGARGEDDEVEILHGRILQDEFQYPGLLIGALKMVTSGIKSYVYKFADAHYSNADFLSITALGYALSAALPRLRREGNMDTPASLSRIPLFLTVENLRHMVETYDWDLYNDEMKFSALSLPAASIDVESESVVPLDTSDYGGGSSGGAGGGGASGGGGSGSGTSLLKVWRSLTNDPSLESFDENTKIALAHLSSFFEVDTMHTFDNKHPIKVKDDYAGLWADGFITAGGVGSSGGGGGGGVDLTRVWQSLRSNTETAFEDSKIHTGHLPDLSAADGLTASYVCTENSSGLAVSTTLNIGISTIAISKVTGLSSALSDLEDAIEEIVPVTFNATNNQLKVDGVTVPFLPLSGGTMDRDASIAFSDQAGAKNESGDLFLSAFGSNTYLGVYNKSGNIYLNTGSVSHADNKVYHRKGSTSYEIWDKYNLPNPVSYAPSMPDGNVFLPGWGLQYEDELYVIPTITDFDPDDYSTNYNIYYFALRSDVAAAKLWVSQNYLPLSGGTITGQAGLTISTGPLSVSSGATSLKNTGITGTLSVTGTSSLASLSASGLATFNGNAKIPSGKKLYFGDSAYIEWDSLNSAIHIVGNVYSDGFATAGGVGSSGGGGGTSTAEWYNIRMKRRANGEYEVTTENYTSSLTNGSMYKMALLRWRKGANRSSSWHAPFLCPPNFASLNSLAQYASWNITGRVQNFLNGTAWNTVISTARMPRNLLKFKATHNRKLRFGCAIYKYTGVGAYGWQRISNIAYVELYINSSTANDIKKSIKVQ